MIFLHIYIYIYIYVCKYYIESALKAFRKTCQKGCNFANRHQIYFPGPKECRTTLSYVFCWFHTIMSYRYIRGSEFRCQCVCVCLHAPKKNSFHKTPVLQHKQSTVARWTHLRSRCQGPINSKRTLV